MDADYIKKTITVLLNIKEHANKVINNLYEILERKEDAFNGLLSSRKVTKENLDALRDEIRVEFRYLRYINHFIEKAIEKVSLIIVVWESGGKEISDTELGKEVAKYNLEFYQIALQELEEAHKLIVFLKEHAEKEQKFLDDAEKSKNSKEFGERYQRFWNEVKDELRASVEVSRLQELKEQLEHLAKDTESINRRFYSINYKGLTIATAGITSAFLLTHYTFSGFGWQSTLIGGTMGLCVGLFGLSIQLLKRKNIGPY